MRVITQGFGVETSSRAAACSQAAPLTPEEFCRDYAAKVYRFAGILSRTGDDAEDLAHDALERAIRHLSIIDSGRGSVDAWLWTLVVHARADGARRHLRRRALLDRMMALGRLEEPMDDVETAAIQRLTANEVLGKVRELSQRDRTLIALRYGADLDVATMSRAVGLTQSATAAALRRALTRLRDHLEARR